jgi:hypothetical protein
MQIIPQKQIVLKVTTVTLGSVGLFGQPCVAAYRVVMWGAEAIGTKRDQHGKRAS